MGTLAWLLATGPSASLRNPVEATEIAERAVALTDHHEAAVLDVLAAAQAASGRFDEAVTTCTAALALGPPPVLAESILRRQGLYKQRRPYVSAPVASQDNR